MRGEYIGLEEFRAVNRENIDWSELGGTISQNPAIGHRQLEFPLAHPAGDR